MPAINLTRKHKIMFAILAVCVIILPVLYVTQTPRHKQFTIVSGQYSWGDLEPSYDPTINQGESVTISLTNINGQYGYQGVSYDWTINGADINNPSYSYTFVGTSPGYYRIVVDATVALPDWMIPYMGSGANPYDIVEGIVGVTVNAAPPTTPPTPQPTPTPVPRVALVTGISGQGTVLINDNLITPGTAYYDQGTTITISATPASGYAFKYWLFQDQDGFTSQSASQTTTITLTESKSALAVFGAIPTPTPTLAPTPTPWNPEPTPSLTPWQPTPTPIPKPPTIFGFNVFEIGILSVIVIFSIAGTLYLKRKKPNILK